MVEKEKLIRASSYGQDVYRDFGVAEFAKFRGRWEKNQEPTAKEDTFKTEDDSGKLFIY